MRAACELLLACRGVEQTCLLLVAVVVVQSNETMPTKGHAALRTALVMTFCCIPHVPLSCRTYGFQVESESHPTHHKCLHRRALALRDLGRLEEALQVLR